MMTRDSLSMAPTDKVVEIAIVGKPVTPAQATEIIRRTDSFFGSNCADTSPYASRVRSLLGAPQKGDFEREPQTHWRRRLAYWDAIEAFRARWGSIDLHWLQNAQVRAADGWCHPDGAIFLAEESGRYPLATDYFDDARAIATAFPFIEMDIALWTPRILPRLSIHCSPESPWPTELRAQVQAPLFGLILRRGDVEAVEGRDGILFRDFGLTYRSAAEVALHEFRKRRRAGAIDSEFGDRRHRRGIGDHVIRSWVETARALGLTA